jgi:PAS domain S-box-containing protein
MDTCSNEKRYRRKDGSVVWVNLNVSSVRKPDGSIDYFVSVTEDISSRKRAEENLRRKDDRLLLAYQTSGLGAFEWDFLANCAVWENDRIFEIYGLTRSDGPLSRAQFFEQFLHPGDAATFQEDMTRGIKSGGLVHTIYRIHRKDRALRWLELTGKMQIAPDGTPIRMIGVVADVTDRQQVQENLRASQEQFRIVADTAPVMIWSSGTDKLCTFFNHPWLDFTGRTMEAELGYGWLEGVHPDDLSHCLRVYTTSFDARESFKMEYRLRRHDGEYRWILDHGVPRFSPGGEFLGYIGSAIDITARRESDERLATIVSSAMDAIITVEENQHIILFNEAAERMFRCPAATAIGTPIDRFIPERFRRTLQRNIRYFGQTGSTARARGTLGALSALRTDGVEFPIEASISIASLGGKKLYTVIVRDLTERRRAEQERDQLAREQAARAAAETASRSKDEFLAMVSHELRSPLNAILGYTRMLRSGPLDRDAINKTTSVVERSAKAQLQIVEDLLDSASIVTGKLRIEPVPIDILPLLETALDAVRTAAEAKRVTLIVDFGSEPEEVFGDPTRLQQIVWNLLTNAIKFTPEGGQVRLSLERAKDHVRLIVSDTGIGIKPEFLPFLFDRFRQADPSSARSFGGLGLGLSLVKHLTELHGGAVTVASEGPGQGATFTVTLPRRNPEFVAPLPTIVPREVRSAATITLDQTLSLDGVRVLIVDDQEEARVVLTQTLAEYGAHVTAVSSGAEAVALLDSQQLGRWPHALILDISMPEEDGYTVLKKIRALESGRGDTATEVPAIALTAYGRNEDRLHALKAGFHMHVTKPVEPTELAVVIHSLTNKRLWQRRWYR